MKCNEVQLNFPELISGRFKDENKSEILAHLEGCPDCRSELENYKIVWQELQQMPEQEPPAELRGNFYKMLRQFKLQESELQNSPGWESGLNRLVRKIFSKQSAYQLLYSAVFLFIGLFAGAQIFGGKPDITGTEIAALQKELLKMNQIASLSLLKQDSPGDRIRGVSWITKLEEPDSEILDAVFHVLNNDENVNVRLAAIDALYIFSDRDKIRAKLIESLQQQSSPLVQVSLINLLVAIRERRAVEAMNTLLHSDKLNNTVKEQAERGIEQLRSL